MIHAFITPPASNNSPLNKVLLGIGRFLLQELSLCLHATKYVLGSDITPFVHQCNPHNNSKREVTIFVLSILWFMDSHTTSCGGAKLWTKTVWFCRLTFIQDTIHSKWKADLQLPGIGKRVDCKRSWRH